MKTVRVSLVLAMAVLAGCATGPSPYDGPSVTYRGMSAQRQVVAQCPTGQALYCRSANDMVGMAGMSCTCVSGQ